jgi:hypothetical protein
MLNQAFVGCCMDKLIVLKGATADNIVTQNRIFR